MRTTVLTGRQTALGAPSHAGGRPPFVLRLRHCPPHHSPSKAHCTTQTRPAPSPRTCRAVPDAAQGRESDPPLEPPVALRRGPRKGPPFPGPPAFLEMPWGRWYGTPDPEGASGVERLRSRIGRQRRCPRAGVHAVTSCPARRRCMKRNRRLLRRPLAALLVLPFALPSAAAAETLAQKRARAHEIMGQLATLDTRMEQVVESYDAATGKLAAIKATHRRRTSTPSRSRTTTCSSPRPAPAARGGHVQAASRRAARRDRRHQELLVDGRPAHMLHRVSSERVDHGRLDRRLSRRPTGPPEDTRHRAGRRRSARRPAHHREGWRRARARRAPVDAARRQGADRPARSRPAGARRRRRAAQSGG